MDVNEELKFWWRGQGGCERRIKVFVKIGGGSGRRG